MIIAFRDVLGHDTARSARTGRPRLLNLLLWAFDWNLRGPLRWERPEPPVHANTRKIPIELNPVGIQTCIAKMAERQLVPIVNSGVRLGRRVTPVELTA